MRLLILVFAVSIAVLLGAAWAIARAIRRHGKAPHSTARSPGSLGLSEPAATKDELEEP